MKNKRFLGLVIAAHLTIGTALLVQPGCQTTQPAAKPVPAVAQPGDEAPIAQGAPRPVNPAFNGGVDNRQPPMRPDSVDMDNASDAPGSILEPLGDKGAKGMAPAATQSSYNVVKGDTLSRIAKQFNTSVAAIKTANNLTGDTIKVGQELMIPGAAPAAPDSIVAGSAKPAAAAEYVVVSGDSLSKIARKFGVSVADIRAVNVLKNDMIRVGQKLVIPAGGSAPKPAAPAPAAATMQSSGDTYTVQPGDTLGVIAKRFNVKVADIMSVNGISDPRKLAAGQVLKLPIGANAPKAADAQKPAAKPSLDQAPAPIIVQPAIPPSGATGGLDSLDSLDDEPATPTVPVQVDETESPVLP
ncbi:MAG: LysM peptidoglycan-binding domain-containing protein [Opitutales bacterium]|jgi:LysM repeat protein